MKTIFRLLFITFISVTIVLIVISISHKEWNAVTAELALIIAIISGWIAYETFRDANDKKKPFITITPDTDSRYDLVQLKITNHGENPAYLIDIEWSVPILNHKGEQVRFNKYNNDYEIAMLNGKESSSVLIDTPSGFFDQHKEKGLIFNGNISYTLKKGSKSWISEPFELSFEHHGASLSYDNEEIKTSFELQKIPKMLEGIQKEIAKLIPPEKPE